MRANSKSPWLRERPPEPPPARRRRTRLALVALVAGATWAAIPVLPAAAADSHGAGGSEHDRHASVESVMKNLMCTCGCSLTVSACEAVMTCEVAAKMKTDIAERIKSGKTVKAVLASFADDYGEQILAAPTKKGFNLAAWISPIGALLACALTVTIALRKWGHHVSDESFEDDQLDPDLALRVEDEVSRGL